MLECLIEQEVPKDMGCESSVSAKLGGIRPRLTGARNAVEDTKAETGSIPFGLHAMPIAS